MHRFSQIDVFTDEFTYGNPVAVVHGADELIDEQLARFAQWTNLSETTFLLAPTEPGADYRLRIFTPARELPFAGHPTLGSARAWLEAGGVPADPDRIVQQCAAGLVPVRTDGERLAFAAPPLLRSGPVAPEDVAQIAAALDLPVSEVVDAQWMDNGPGWVALLLADADTVLRLEQNPQAARAFPDVGVIGPHPAGSATDYEVRALVPWLAAAEDPVTGSLNAGLAQWLIGAGIAPPSYTVTQGTRLGRRGRVYVDQVGADIWIGGNTVVGITGNLHAW